MSELTHSFTHSFIRILSINATNKTPNSFLKRDGYKTPRTTSSPIESLCVQKMCIVTKTWVKPDNTLDEGLCVADRRRRRAFLRFK